MGKKDKLSSNPLMAYKKDQKKKEIAKGKKATAEKKEAVQMLRDPALLGDEIKKVEDEAKTNRADLGLKRKLDALKSHQAVLLKKTR
eukprot:CAMPEP_0184245712 /NCGR_PEP_ID=MMETSP0977-20130417/1585_1 /TAXON_ID=483370 /ORGANISM="non described non described, Strain CCMP2097" /LENGTH=86 /DNA_ID=CAMNT_0026551015 /DNA_START=80 /DNA_END=337 /DNA_ORIENTATION=-